MKYTHHHLPLIQVAQKLKCTPEELLHLGVGGDIQIFAPVFAEGIYEWRVEDFISAFPTIESSFTWNFTAIDRVFLFRNDLLLLEARKWVIPACFGCGDVAKKLINNDACFLDGFDHPYPLFNHSMLANHFAEERSQLSPLDAAVVSLDITKYESGQKSHESWTKKEVLDDVIKNLISRDPRADESESRKWREMKVSCAVWHTVSPIQDDAPRTTIDDLFINTAHFKHIKTVLSRYKKFQNEDQNPSVDVNHSANDAHPFQTDIEKIEMAAMNENFKSDPQPEQPWYTPARYLARELVKEDPSLLKKRATLAKKVASKLQEHGVNKRGNTKSLQPSTVLKAFSNVNLS